MIKELIETCFNCEKQKTCRATQTLQKYQNSHVPCVFYQKKSETELVYHDKHLWKKASTNYAHMNGVSWLGWCTRCGAEGGPLGAEHKCHSLVVTKKYRVGGHYRKEHLKQGFKIYG